MELPDAGGRPGDPRRADRPARRPGRRHHVPVQHLLPRRQHHPVRRQVVDLDGGPDRLDQHRQGRGRGGAGDRRRRAQERASTLSARRDARDPRADRRGRPAAQHRRHRHRPTRRRRAGTRTSATAARTSARPCRRGGGGRIPPRGVDRLARLVRAADRRAPASRAGRARRATAATSTGSSSGASASRRRAWTAGAHGRVERRRGHGLRHAPIWTQIRAALAAARRRPDRDDLGGPDRSTSDPRRPLQDQFTVRLMVDAGDGDAIRGVRPQGAHRARRPDAAAGLPQAHGHRRRGAAALRRPRRRQRAGAGRCRPRTARCTPTSPTAPSCPAGR